MRAFVDTSALFKKYVEESGSGQLEKLLQDVTNIAVSPVTWVEVNTVVARRLRDKSLTAQQAAWLRLQIQRDFQSFDRVVWNEALEKTAVGLASQYPLSTLDAIQLASGILSKADVFVTSDRRLFEQAKQAVRHAVAI